MENLKKAIGLKIKQRRLELGFSQDVLADKISPDIDRTRISDWERGHALPSPKYRPALLKALQSDESLFDPRINTEETKTVDRANLIGTIVNRLASLNDAQLSAALALIEVLPSLDLAGLDLPAFLADIIPEAVGNNRKDHG